MARCSPAGGSIAGRIACAASVMHNPAVLANLPYLVHLVGMSCTTGDVRMAKVDSKPGSCMPPRAVICAGIFSSGSTWIFNAVQQILRSHAPEASPTPLYLDTLDDSTGSELWRSSLAVIKTHAPGSFLRCFAAVEAAPVILSVRDPRDAVASLMLRFFFSFEEASDLVLRACHNLPLLLQDIEPGKVLFLRYEDGFTRRRATLAEVARHIGVSLPKETIASIAAALAPKAVNAQIQALRDRGIFDDGPPSPQFDPQTHWHPRHLGDGKSGKWQAAMTQGQASALIARSGFLRPIYGFAPLRPVAMGQSVRFGADDEGVQYLGEGFHYDEGHKMWGMKGGAIMILPFARPIAGELFLKITCQADASMPDDTSPLGLRVNGKDVALALAPPTARGRITLTARIEALPAVTQLTLALNRASPAQRSDRPAANLTIASVRLTRPSRTRKTDGLPASG